MDAGRGARGVRRPRRRAPVAAPGRRGRGRPRRSARGAGHRHRVGQVAGLPAARGSPRSWSARLAWAARGHRALPRPHQGARPRPARRGEVARARRAGCHPRRRQQPRAARLDPRRSGSTSSPTPTCCTARCSQDTSGGPRFLGSLRYVVVDECHHYRGVFGAHVSHVLRRLRRVCASYGASPTFVLASATVADPEVAAARLTGLDVMALTADDSPRGRLAARAVGAAVHLARRRERRARPAGGLLGDRRPARRPGRRRRADPGLHPVPARGRAGRGDRRRAAGGGRPGAAGAGRGLPRRLPARGAPRARAALRSGDLLGLAATNALELGIDISGLDAVADRRLPRHPRRAVAAGRSGRSRAARTRSGSWWPATTRWTPTSCTHPEALLRPAGRGDGLRPRQPVRPGPAPLRRRPGDPADRGRPAAVRADGGRGRRRADRGGAAAPPTARLVLDRPAAGQRPGRHPLDRRVAGAARRRGDRAGRRHRRRRRRARDGPPGRGLPPPGRDLAGDRPRPRRQRRADAPGARPRLLHHRARGHRDQRAARSVERRPGASAGCRSARSR